MPAGSKPSRWSAIASLGFAFLLCFSPALALPVGENVTNPVTGASEKVVAVLAPGIVLTDKDNSIIVTPPAIGSTFEEGGVTYTVSEHVQGTYGVIAIKTTKADNSAGPEVPTVQDQSAGLGMPGDAAGNPGDSGGPIDVEIPTGNVNVVADKRVGARGAGGNNGYGVEICIPLIGCATIGYSGTSGKPGGNGPEINRTITVEDNGNVESVTDELPGITVSSRGGNGGGGGNSYGALPGLQGGAAGHGGTVNVVTSVDVTTSGIKSHGVFVQSRGGSGGAGGVGYGLSGGGSGGPASAGGSVTLNNSGAISTLGGGAIGLFAQSIGGGGGTGGDSYGLVGNAGTASEGGNGGTVAVINSGSITTVGIDAHGILAQSIGGSGGNSGDAVGIVALGSPTGGGGGYGSAVSVENRSGGHISTGGAGAFGIFAQSVGGGGGNGGYAAGLVAFGGSGTAGGNAGAVTITTNADSSVTTQGVGAHGIVGQSVGGGGGFGGTGGGAVAFGGSGSAAGNGAAVSITNAGVVHVSGADARGIIAQSIGGGGGGASGSGGIVSLGGSGGAGGTGGAVTLVNSGAVTTIGTGGDALFAQSIGGGGGSGAASGGLVAIGGGGSVGGAGGAVMVTNSGALETSGARARGIFAQSIGGGGGSGGDTGGLVAIGGDGSAASNAGAVTVANSGSVNTSGAAASAIHAQSIGGGGGDGGTTGGLFSVGGSGSGGGDGGVVVVSNSHNLTTEGADAYGIFAQSVGGGGGSGGNAISISTVAGLAIGGDGGSGGDGKATSATFDNRSVTVSGQTYSVAPRIVTAGDRAGGVLVQSIGGGGGNGGFAAQGTVSAGASIGLALGGAGASGGAGGAVTVGGAVTIETGGANAAGILAQSVGGGGGNGGFAVAVSASATAYAANLGLGGSGGSGGAGGAVTVDTDSTVSTVGNMSAGLVAQSVGGGGGNGGFAVSAGAGAASASVAIGGNASAGGNAGAVAVLGSNSISTKGANSIGLLAQSVGGGGGNGGFAGSGSLGLVSAAVAVGSSGGAGGNAGIIVVDNAGNIVTEGAASSALVAQSIGGGGGNGGIVVDAAIGMGSIAVGVGGSGGVGGSASAVTVGSVGNIVTLGDRSIGILGQSIGGGGGDGGFSAGAAIGVSPTTPAFALGVNVGGSGGSGTTGGTVEVTSRRVSPGEPLDDPAGTYSLITAGRDAAGIIAQSIGGGGGNGGVAATLAGALGPSQSGAASVSVGGFGAGGGHAAAVSVDSDHDIATLGENSFGILAQSIGGGGGNGGLSIGVAAATGYSGAFSVGGFGAAGGNAGTVSVTNGGTIVTLGSRATALLAQSIGGGGGNGGASISGAFSLGPAGLAASVGGMAGTGGLGGDVTVHSNVGATIGVAPTIQTYGDSAHGIAAQSIGGGGGNGGFSGAFTATANAQASMSLSVGGFGAAGNRSGLVTVTAVDNILTSGDGSNGILAQSIGGGGGDGGFSFAGTVSVPTGNSFSMSASLGGFGGAGGDAAAVVVDATGFIQASGNNASGVVAQSIGGGGGNGGMSVAGTFNLASSNNVPSLTASVGGMGGSGGAGSSVTVDRNGDTRTVGDKSFGILAQSIGGGGGNGGLSVAGSIGGTDAKQISASVGGFGGDGSQAGSVTVTNVGAITTGSATEVQMQLAEVGEPQYVTGHAFTGYGSAGIMAQSIGGGGGNGGFAFSGSLAPFGENTSLNVGLTVGGLGGDGGRAGDVLVTNNGLVTTIGPEAAGIVAQSVGGGGGNGGAAVTGQLAGGDPQGGGRAVNVGVTVGGMGGDGNVAGKVTVHQDGGIVTHGAGSDGILAQSLGGGGGTGGGANTISLSIATSCTFSKLNSVISSCQAPKRPSVNAQVGVGGFGGTGNDGNTVDVTNLAAITTLGSASSGIYAESVGGGGGKGGQAIFGFDGLFPGAQHVDEALTAANFLFGGGSVKTGLGRVTVGGFGGAGGDGDAVTVNNEGVIQTSGDSSYGIFAHSIGGGGGSGGNASSGLTGPVSVGGFGAASGKGGTVTVTNLAGAAITTFGLQSTAIMAQSVGGGGGNGGGAGAAIGIGGFGGASGDGGAVKVTNDGVLRTEGDQALGIFAQSAGGGGGNGGGTGFSLISIGGLAGVLGSTGDGNLVEVINGKTAGIVTLGIGSHGIHAQSLGGGGGSGAGSTVLAAGVSVGGQGGSAGSGGLVTVDNAGDINTYGINAHGLFAQSIGGSGGNAGGTTISLVTVGGGGGSAGNGGAVQLTNSGVITTSSAMSDAIRGQSIGGGGGSASAAEGGALGGGALVVVGASGGSSGNGGAVTIGNKNLLITSGNIANGIFAQSIGGGGGDSSGVPGLLKIGGADGATGSGGKVVVTNSDLGVIWTKGAQSNAIFAQSVGGGGGNVTGIGNEDIFDSTIGGDSGGSGGVVEVDNAGLLQADGIFSQAIFAQSIGGGGGNGLVHGALSALAANKDGLVVGGSGGTGGAGGAVTVTNKAGATIQTNGFGATAVFAQSVGGGGGNGGYARTGTAFTGTSSSVSLGGVGGAGGDGGDVTVTNDGLIEINGDSSVGIMAQSVGGGGGTAASASGDIAASATIGGGAGVDGDGGEVVITNTGSIAINGSYSVGLFAQSVGGGGGLIKPYGGASSLTLSDEGNGNAGTVRIDNTAGIIIVTGDNSVALYAQSVGGGGGSIMGRSDASSQPRGAFIFSGTSGGSGIAQTASVNQTGSLVAEGGNSVALFAQSNAEDGAEDIVVNIYNKGPDEISIISGGSGKGAGIVVLEGATNTVTNAGVVTNVLGVNGFAVRATSGDDSIINTGAIVGSLDLELGLNSFYNSKDAYFLSGETLALGADNLFTNAGVTIVGGWDNVAHTDVTGDFIQTADGYFGVDLDLGETAADQMTVSGTALLSGELAVNLIDPASAAALARPGRTELTLMSAAEGLSVVDLTFSALETAVLKQRLVTPNATDLLLQYEIDYVTSGMNDNQRSVGMAINDIQSAQDSPGFADLAALLFYQPDDEALAAAYDALSGAETSAAQQLAFSSSAQFGNLIQNQMLDWMSKLQGPGTVSLTGTSTNAYVREGIANPTLAAIDYASREPALEQPHGRAWLTGLESKGRTSGDIVVGSVNHTTAGGLVGAGFDLHVGSNATLGVAVGQGSFSFNAPERLTSGVTDATHFAVYGGAEFDRAYATGTVSFGSYENRTSRFVGIPGVTLQQPTGLDEIDGIAEQLGGQFRSTSVGGRVELGYRFGDDGWELTPFLAAQIDVLRSDGYAETSPDPVIAGMSFNNRTITSLPTTLGTRFRSVADFGNGTLLTSTFHAAWQREWSQDRSTEGAFIDAPDHYFIVHGAQPAVDTVLLGLSETLSVGSNVAVTADVRGQFSPTGQNYHGSLTLSGKW